MSYAHVTPKYRPSTTSALILTPDPLAGALMAATVELVGVPPVFSLPDEKAKTALRRCRPRYVMLSHDEPSLRDESFLGPALMTGARIFVFGTQERLAAIQPVLAHHRIEVIVLPNDLPSLRELLRAETESTPRRPPTTGP